VIGNKLGGNMLHLSRLIGRPVRDGGTDAIGVIDDLIAAVGANHPPVTGLVVRTGRRRIYLPWSSVTRLDADGARLGTERIDISRFRKRDNEILLRADLLDRQIVDIDGRKVVRANDVLLDDVEGAMRVVAVDVGAAGLLRRLGLPEHWIDRLSGGRSRVASYIDWEDVDPLGSTIAAVRLRVPHAGLSELHPADLATIIDQLTPRDRAEVISSLDDEIAAEALEELEPEVRADLLEDLEPERAADLLEEMSPDEAADAVADLSPVSRAEILRLMEKEERDDVRELLAHPETSAGGLMTTEHLAVRPTATVAATLAALRRLKPDADVAFAIYVVDAQRRLLGEVTLRDLVLAEPSRPVAELMEDEPVAVELLAHADEVARVVTRYGLVAVPVVDEGRRLVGVITVADALWDVLPEEWRHEMPRRIRAGSLAAGGPIELPAKLRPRTKGTAKGTAKGKAKAKPRAKRGVKRG
jgi:CBS domain-containing protein/sporulation protein YlmC with PRC-barrel domain